MTGTGSVKKEGIDDRLDQHFSPEKAPGATYHSGYYLEEIEIIAVGIVLENRSCTANRLDASKWPS